MALKLTKIVAGGALVFREHAVFDEIDCRDDALDIFVHTASVYHWRVGTSKNRSCDGRLWETVLPVVEGTDIERAGSRKLEGGEFTDFGRSTHAPARAAGALS